MRHLAANISCELFSLHRCRTTLTSTRLEWYASVKEPDTIASTPTQLESSMSLTSRSRPMSSAESDKVAVYPLKQDGIYHTRSPSKTKATAWTDGNAQPKIFPGIVHERARRSSIRQGSGSDKDVEPVSPLIKASRRLGQAISDDGDYCRAVMEEGDEAKAP